MGFRIEGLRVARSSDVVPFGVGYGCYGKGLWYALPHRKNIEVSW